MRASILLRTLVCLLVCRTTLSQEAQIFGPSDKLPKGYFRVEADRAVAIEKLCRATHETGLFSGAVLVADKGEIIYRDAFGFANREWKIANTTDTKFRIASLSKQFCSMLVMQLV